MNDGSKNIIGNPLIKEASIEAKILDQIINKKIIVFKKRKRKNSRSTRGHRQYLTVLKIENISNGNKKSIPALSSSKVKNKITKGSIEALDNKKEKTLKKQVVKKSASKKTTKKKTITKKTVKKKTIKSN